MRLFSGCLPIMALLLVLAAATSTAAAATAATAAIVRADGDGGHRAAALIAQFFRQQIQEDTRFTLVNVGKSLGDSAAARAASALALADKELAEARTSYESMDLNKVVDKLNSAVSRFDNNVAYLTDMQKVADTLLFLGACHLLLEEKTIGIRRVQQALAIDPELEKNLDPGLFNLKDRRLVAKAAAELRRRRKGSLSVTSTPSYAEVFVDGRFVGVTPMVVEQLPAGRHYVRLHKDGMRGTGKVVKVGTRAGRNQPMEMRAAEDYDNFDRLSHELVGNIDSKNADAVEGMGTRLGLVDYMLVARVRLNAEVIEVSAVLYDLNDRFRVVRRGEQSFSYVTGLEIYRSEVAAMYQRVFSEQATEPGSELGERGAGIDPNSGVCMGMSCGSFKTVLMGGGLIGGGVMMGLGAVFWGLAKSDNSAFDGAVQVSQRAADLEQSGKLKAALGDTFFVVGAAALGTASLLYYFYVPGPTPRDVISSGQGRFGLTVAPYGDGLAVGATVKF